MDRVGRLASKLLRPESTGICAIPDLGTAGALMLEEVGTASVRSLPTSAATCTVWLTWQLW